MIITSSITSRHSMCR